MFQRFTERARQAVVHAQDEARELGHPVIRTEHLLLGLLRVEDGVAARVLVELGLTLDAARADVLRIVGRGDGMPDGQVPFEPRAKKALELALREALSLGHNHIGTEHVLLGLAREADGTAAEVLRAHDLDAERIRDEVVRMIGAGPRQRPQRFGRPRRRRWEYCVEVLEELNAERLNELGADGWEVAAVVREEGGYRTVFKRARR